MGNSYHNTIRYQGDNSLVATLGASGAITLASNLTMPTVSRIIFGNQTTLSYGGGGSVQLWGSGGTISGSAFASDDLFINRIFNQAGSASFMTFSSNSVNFQGSAQLSSTGVLQWDTRDAQLRSLVTGEVQLISGGGIDPSAFSAGIVKTNGITMQNTSLNEGSILIGPIGASSSVGLRFQGKTSGNVSLKPQILQPPTLWYTPLRSRCF